MRNKLIRRKADWKGDITQLQEEIKKDPLRMETRHIGLMYNSGEGFFDTAYHMVRGIGVKNMVLKASSGLCVEANKKEIIVAKGLNLPERVTIFDPYTGIYALGPPFFVQISTLLNAYLHDAMINGEKVTIESNISSQFGGTPIIDKMSRYD